MRRQIDLAPSLPGTIPQVVDSGAKWAQAIPNQPKRIASIFLLLAVFLSVLAMPALAQLGATIAGVVTDPSGAAVPGATLTLTDQDTALVIATGKSDTTGNFEFLAVRAPGSYTISVQVAGFSRFEKRDIVVTAGERRSVGSLPLVVGTASEEVSVSADV